MQDEKTEVMKGTPDLLVLKSLEVMGSLHGWGIARSFSRPPRAVGEERVRSTSRNP